MDRYTCENLAVNFQYWCAPCNTFFHAGQRQTDFPNGIEVRCWLGHRSLGLSRTPNIHSNQNAETDCLGPSMMTVNALVRLLIRNAYQVRGFQVLGGPSWI